MAERCSTCGGRLHPGIGKDVMSALLGSTPGHTAWICESCGSSFLRQGGPGNAPPRGLAVSGARVLLWLLGAALLAVITFLIWGSWR